MKALVLIVSLFASLAACAGGNPYQELRTVNYLELGRYQGLWYEVYRFPNSFERNCANVTAKYDLNKNGTVGVINTCVNEISGQERSVKGTAFVTDPDTNASLKVSFVPFFQRWGLFAGDYNVIALGDDYEWAVVGSQDRQFLWFLSRTPELSDETVELMKEEAASQDFDLSKLIKTPRI